MAEAMTAGDDAERSDEKERRLYTAGDDQQGSAIERIARSGADDR
jgi:hypothetical protein